MTGVQTCALPISENLAELWGVNTSQTAELLMQDTTQAEREILDSLSGFDFDDI